MGGAYYAISYSFDFYYSISKGFGTFKTLYHISPSKKASKLKSNNFYFLHYPLQYGNKIIYIVNLHNDVERIARKSVYRKKQKT